VIFYVTGEILIQFLRYKEKGIIDTMIELKTLIEKYVSEGISINRIKKEVLEIVNEKETVYSNKKKKRKPKREICRPVMFISDSSCDEEN